MAYLLFPDAIFSVVALSVTNVFSWRSTSVAVAAKTLRPHLKSMSSRREGVLSNLDPVNSPGQRRKNYAIIIRSHSPWSRESLKVLSMLGM